MSRTQLVDRAKDTLLQFIEAQSAGATENSVKLTREELLSWFLEERPALAEFREELTRALQSHGTFKVKLGR